MIPQIGLTGNIGSGKSTVAHLFGARGAAVIDADALARRAGEDPEVLRRIAADLGDADALRRLNAIIHPWVARARQERTRALQTAVPPPPLIVHDIPLLFEVGLEDAFDAVVVVVAPLEQRIARVAARSGLSPDEVRARDAAQLPLELKAARADHVIDNGGDVAALAPQLERLWRALVHGAPP